MKRCVIVGGAEIHNYNRIMEYLRPDDFYIFCDCGLRHLKKLNVQADLIVGDFDSHAAPKTSTEIIFLPCEKDDTDTIFAVKEAIRRGFESFLLIGAVGGRMDHTLGNISALLLLHRAEKSAVLVDDYSTMELVGRAPASIDDTCLYFSLINLFGTAKGIDIAGAKYSLKDAEICPEYQYGISNEVLKGKTATVSVKDGILLLIKVYAEPQTTRN